MFYFSNAASVKGEGSVNVGLFLCAVNSSLSTLLYSFWCFLTLFMLVFLSLWEGDGVTPGMIRQ